MIKIKISNYINLIKLKSMRIRRIEREIRSYDLEKKKRKKKIYIYECRYKWFFTRKRQKLCVHSM